MPSPRLPRRSFVGGVLPRSVILDLAARDTEINLDFGKAAALYEAAIVTFPKSVARL